MSRRLMSPTADDVSTEAVQERGAEKLAAWFDALRAGDAEAVGSLQELIGCLWGDDSYPQLEEAMRVQCEEEALEEILAEMDDALDSYVCGLIDDMNYDFA